MKSPNASNETVHSNNSNQPGSAENSHSPSVQHETVARHQQVESIVDTGYEQLTAQYEAAHNNTLEHTSYEEVMQVNQPPNPLYTAQDPDDTPPNTLYITQNDTTSNSQSHENRPQLPTSRVNNQPMSNTDFVNLNLPMRLRSSALGQHNPCLRIAASAITIATLAWLILMIYLGVHDHNEETKFQFNADNQQEIFSAHGIAAWTDRSTPISFAYIDTNIGQSFSGTKFQPRKNGIFMLYMSSAVPSSGVLNVTLLDNTGVNLQSLYVTCQKSSTSFSTLQLVRLSQTQSVFTVSETPLDSITDNHQSAKIIGFRADESTMSPFIAWQKTFTSASIDNSSGQIMVSTDANYGTDQLNANWSAAMFVNNSIRVPVDGIYIVSMIAKFHESYLEGYSRILFSVNKALFREEIRYSTVMFDNLMISVFHLTRLTTGDKLMMHVALPQHPIVSATMMLYSPANIKKTAWSITMEFGRNVTYNRCAVVVRENIDVSCCTECPDQCNISATVTQDGLYYIALTVNTYPASADCVRVYYRVNSTAASILCTSVDGNRTDLDILGHVQQSTILRLSAGDRFKIHTDINSTAPPPSIVHTKDMRFAGFALHQNVF